MSSPAPDDRKYDRDEVELILRTAVEIDHPAAPPLTVDGDELTLSEIQDIASQAGIDRSAIATATLSVALGSAHEGHHKMHHVHAIAGEISGAAWDQLADAIRSAISGADVRRTPGTLEFEIDKRSGERGRLLVSIRSQDGATTVSIWSDAPHLSPLDIASCAVLGVPVALFPVVASNAGVWPTLGWIAGLGALGSAVGTVAAIGWQRWAVGRWRDRVTALLSPIVARATELASDVSAKTERATEPPRIDSPRPRAK